MHQDAPPPPPAGRPTIEFRSAYDQGFARVAAVTLPVALADPAANAAAIIEQARSLSDDGVCLAAFPELSLTGYSIDDLLLSDVLLDEVLAAIETIRAASAGLLPAIIVGAPLRDGSRLYNCAVVIQGGAVRGVAPKSYLPTYREFYEKRHFASGDGAPGAQRILLPAVRAGAEAAAVGNAVGDRDDGVRVPFGPHLLFEVADVPGLTFHVEVCEDMWVPVPPSSLAALAGATVLVNLSGSPITVGRAEDRKLLARASSARNLAAYVFAAAGQGESSTDLAWDGQTFVYENGELLGETERFPDGPRATVVDVDIEGLRAERLRQGSFEDNRAALSRAAAPAGSDGSSRFLTLSIEPRELRVPRTDIGLRRAVDRFPFVPDDPARLAQDCYEAYSIQVAALAQRLRAIGLPTIVIGVSGGLDSTHALIVAARAVDRLGLGREHIHAITMPGFATSEGTKSNALALARALGCHVEELDIRPAAEQMLTAMGHPYGRGERGREVYDVTFENVQAGLRTDFLFRIANQRGGIVLGTGDLSELALGWCTFGVGDQMAHYGVNAGIPKTLIQHLIRWVVAERIFSDDVGRVLLAILGTEISPELVPADDGEPIQSTQAKIGPYALQDFTLWHVLRRGSRPSRIAFLAEKAWADASAGQWPVGLPEKERVAYDLATIRRWELLFLRR
ncbi:NAD(+) synthase, partial [Actinomyces massiliensis]|uniref:NAD(+) synthase n=1 Tax=Actinomyces massiliensis TaxID=461393 RepID=UPI0028E91BB2